MATVNGNPVKCNQMDNRAKLSKGYNIVDK